MIRPLSSKLLEKAKAELNEDPTRIKQDLEHIEEWLEKQPHLVIKKDRQYLLNFLRSSKFSLQRTKDKLDYLYSMKFAVPEMGVKNPRIPEMETIIREGVIVPVTKIVSEDPFPVVLLIRWKKTNPKKMPYVNLIKALLMYLDILLQENDNCAVCGCLFVYDMKQFPFSYVTQLTPYICMRTIMVLQNAYPYRLKGLLFLNTSKICEVLINAVLPFLEKNIKERIKIFKEGELGKLYDFIPKEFLPRDYGGKTRSLKELTIEWHQVLSNHRDWFREENECGSDESKRTEKSLVINDMLGIDGSFRSLREDL